MDIIEEVLAIAIGVIAASSMLAPIIGNSLFGVNGSYIGCTTGFMGSGTVISLLGLVFIVSLFMIVRSAWKKKA